MKTAVYPGKQNVFINAVTGDTWITYKQDDAPIKKFVLKKNRTLLIRGDEIRLFLGNINVTKIFLNNQLLDIDSKNGIKSLVFPKENKAKYVLPLFLFKEDGTVITSDEYLKSQGVEAKNNTPAHNN